ncbi:MAG: LysR family transcriptional regulator [Eubacteriaceae bacterium]|jgi:DNA-binding transcriptional LysR family regulator|nr:LysR family transcriptional regulator [Eubacteriaceae bacterium]
MFSNKEYVYEVYKQQSFSKAARKLYISQPALSSSIKKLEEQIGMPLFDRSTNPIKLTECGRVYINAVEQIINLENNFSEFIDALTNNKCGEVKIGGSNVFVSFILPSIIRKFQDSYPNIQIILEQGSTKELEKMLTEGDIDFVVEDNLLERTIFDYKKFRQEMLLLVVPRHYVENEKWKDCQLTSEDVKSDRHLFDDIKSIRLSSFSDRPFVMLNEGNESRKRLDIMLQNEKITPKIAISLEQQQTAYHMACAGAGLCLVSDITIQNLASCNDIVIYKVDENYSAMNLYLYFKHSRLMTSAMRVFVDTCLPEK